MPFKGKKIINAAKEQKTPNALTLFFEQLTNPYLLAKNTNSMHAIGKNLIITVINICIVSA